MGVVISLIGLFLFISGLTKSDFFIYRLFVTRSKMLWKDEQIIHKFYQVVGVIIVIFVILVTPGVLKKVISIERIKTAHNKG